MIMVRSFFFLLALLGLGPVVQAQEVPVSFRHDVMAVFSKAGCNNGGCHGNFKGKGDLRLSLRGESPETDHAALIGTGSSRLLLPETPERSLLLRKPTRQLRHEGGLRFEVDSPEYEILHQWIAAGMPSDPPETPRLIALEVTPDEAVIIEPAREASLKVTARFSDGSERDVSRWAVYEPSELICDIDVQGRVTAAQAGETTVTVRYLHLQKPVRLAFVAARPDYQWSAPDAVNAIDKAVFSKLRRLRMNPSTPCDDATFIRRATLDLLGLLPTREEAERFLADSQPNKRAHLIDMLLERPEFADQWALKWSDLLRNEEKALDEKGVLAFHQWIRDSIAANKPMDQFSRELVTGLGSTYENPPANYYRALREPTLRAEATAQLFLGTRLQCARCHQHPYERWSQDDYYQFAAVFDGIGYEILKNERRDKLDKNQFIGEQLVKVGLKRELKDPRSGSAPLPALLPIPGMQATSKKEAPLPLEELGRWLTSRDNPLFARVQANRVWFQIFGRGIVDPVDDFRSTNPPINPALLEVISREFIDSGFDLKHLIRFIMNSSTYQLDSLPNATNADDERNFSRNVVKRHSAETLLDAMHQVLETTPEFSDTDSPIRAAQLPGVENIHRNRKPKKDERFLKLFGRPVRQINSDLERSNTTSLAQVFEMTSGRTLHRILAAPENRLGRLLDSDQSDDAILAELYWCALTRPPTSAEAKAAHAHLQRTPRRRDAFEDITWALLNSKAFMLRR